MAMAVQLVGVTRVVRSRLANLVTKATHKQMCEWTAGGVITPHKQSTGSGDHIGWSRDDLICLRVIRELVLRGVPVALAGEAGRVVREGLPTRDSNVFLIVTKDECLLVNERRFQDAIPANVAAYWVLDLPLQIKDLDSTLRRYAPEMVTE